jgi:4-aminobutyrate aminotransferase-like enzyme/Ser/Thr protein kinase RdoA (MazF antagonist)
MVEHHDSAHWAAQVAARFYGIKGTAHRLAGELDDNYLIDAGAGKFVLKVMHPDREASMVEMQAEALRHVSQSDETLTIPELIPSLEGTSVSHVTAADGRNRLIWLLRYIEGRPLAESSPQGAELRRSLGAHVARVDSALLGFEHPAAIRDFKWNSSKALWICEHLEAIADANRRTIVRNFMDLYRRVVVPAILEVPSSAIHADANEHNTLTQCEAYAIPGVIALIDYGDLHRGMTVSGLAIAIAYAIFGQEDVLTAMAEIVEGYATRRALTDLEIRLIHPLVAARLCVSVVNCALRAKEAPDDPYVTISERPAWQALERLASIDANVAYARLRAAAGRAEDPRNANARRWIEAHSTQFLPLFSAEALSYCVLDQSVESLELGADPQRGVAPGLTRHIQRRLTNDGNTLALGRYGEVRGARAAASLDVEVYALQGLVIVAPLAGTLEAVTGGSEGQATLVLRHQPAADVGFFTVYRLILPAKSLTRDPGSVIERGQALGTLPPRGPGIFAARIQVDLGLDGAYSGAPSECASVDLDWWSAISINPAVLLGIPPAALVHRSLAADQLAAARSRRLGGNLSLSYDRPLKIVRGWKQYLYDDLGRQYLDVFNNVPLVGHSHPRVVDAVQRQVALLNTNTRYLHENIVRYAERLTALMPAELSVCYFMNSASEANELALRIARAATGRRDVVVLEHAYHGNTTTLIDISPYKFQGVGGYPKPDWVHVAPIPDDYRGSYRRGDPDVGGKYAAEVQGLLAGGVAPAAFIAESLPSVGGQIVLPARYLEHVYRAIREAGGICIADEVQVGFGRLGAEFWGFATQGVVPDVVVLGKPIGNAFPLAAVVTTAQLAKAFNNGMEYFSTFGGNPVACAAGLAVLDVLRDESLPANAARIGSYLKDRLSELMTQYEVVGDVRGLGLFLGVELVECRSRRTPAGRAATYVVNRLKSQGILAGTDGPHHNVIKIRPPLCIGQADADHFVSTVHEVLAEDGLRSFAQH